MSPRNTCLQAPEEPLPLMTLSMAPLAAVMLALVAVWASATPNAQHVVNVTIQAGCLAISPPEQTRVIHTLGIAADGALAWDGQTVPDRTALNARMSAMGAASAAEQDEVRVDPHPLADYGAVVAVLAAAQRNGVRLVGVSGEGFYARPATAYTYE